MKVKVKNRSRESITLTTDTATKVLFTDEANIENRRVSDSKISSLNSSFLAKSLIKKEK